MVKLEKTETKCQAGILGNIIVTFFFAQSGMPAFHKQGENRQFRVLQR